MPDAYADSRFYPEVDKESGFKTRSILCVPLLRGEAEIGVLQVLNPIGGMKPQLQLPRRNRSHDAPTRNDRPADPANEPQLCRVPSDSKERDQK